MRPKSEIYTPKRDDEHPHHFDMRSLPPGLPPNAVFLLLARHNKRVRRQQSVPTTSIETVVLEGGAYSFFRIWDSRLHLSQLSNERTIGETVTLKKVERLFTI